MKINELYNLSNVNSSQYAATVSKAMPKETPEINPLQKAYEAKSTYQASTDRINTNFGGYDNSGRLLNKSQGVKTIDGTVTPKKREDNTYIVNGVAEILNTDSKNVETKMKDMGMQPEDLVNPEKTSKLSTQPETKAKLSDFAINQRNEIKNKSGMSEEELTDFLRKATDRKFL